MQQGKKIKQLGSSLRCPLGASSPHQQQEHHDHRSLLSWSNSENTQENDGVASTSCITGGFYSTCGGGSRAYGVSERTKQWFLRRGPRQERITCQPADSCRQTEAALLEEGRGEITGLQPRAIISTVSLSWTPRCEGDVRTPARSRTSDG